LFSPEEFYNKKLWHQLTLELNQLVKEPAMKVTTCFFPELKSAGKGYRTAWINTIP
jgi:hypothetical protein